MTNTPQWKHQAAMVEMWATRILIEWKMNFDNIVEEYIETQIAKAEKRSWDKNFDEWYEKWYKKWAEEMKKKCLSQFTNWHNCSFEEVYDSISSL